MSHALQQFHIRQGDACPFDVLTARELDVLPYVTLGKPNKVIAAELGVSQRTVEAHRARIFEKLRVRNAVELTHRYLRWQLSAPEAALQLAEPAPRDQAPASPGA